MMSSDYFVLKNSKDLDYTTRSATNSKPIYMNNVHCSGQERTLLDCSYSRNLSLNEHHKDVGLQCRKCKLHIITRVKSLSIKQRKNSSHEKQKYICSI